MPIKDPEKRKAYQKKYRETHKEEMKAYWKKYREAHREERKAYHKRYRETHKEQIEKYHETHKEERNAFSREYHAKYIVTKHHSYIGVCICEKCGRKGYKRYLRHYNKKTGNYSKIRTYVHHQHSEDGKTVNDGACYIGIGEL